MKLLHSICQQFWKTQQWPQDWKSQFLFQFQRKAVAKMFELLHNCTHLSSVQFSRSVMFASLWPHGLQHTGLPCPSSMIQRRLLRLQEKNRETVIAEPPWSYQLIFLWKLWINLDTPFGLQSPEIKKQTNKQKPKTTLQCRICYLKNCHLK